MATTQISLDETFERITAELDPFDLQWKKLDELRL
jgi:hypothetical protein